MKIGIAGYGYVGKAHELMLEPYHDIIISDPAQGHYGDLRHADAIIICVSTPGSSNGHCDVTNVGDVLEISYVGYTTQSVNVGASNFYNIVMQSDNTLDEVVIVGYGTTTKKSFACTATNIKAENIESKNFSNITQAISGEVAGVSVINTSGQPGTIGTVRIRGYGSPLGNRNPLYVVDGVAFG